ncbi:hypothetical protein EBG89_07630 [Salmonella enterica]|nr:hypothetical protein [Salmonella enterica]ECO1791180.1 hypothetical protein [Salmonella enterica]
MFTALNDKKNCLFISSKKCKKINRTLPYIKWQKKVKMWYYFLKSGPFPNIILFFKFNKFRLDFIDS